MGGFQEFQANLTKQALKTTNLIIETLRKFQQIIISV
jgi:hypothetical protein